MTTKNCLIVLQPREIPVCLDAIGSLPIDKLYLRAMQEVQLCEPIANFINNTSYDNYLVVSDDVVVTKQALSLVEDMLERYESATGYCRLAMDSDFVNLSRAPLKYTQGTPSTNHYGFYHINEVRSFQKSEFVTWFGGWCLTGFRREIWLEHPFRVTKTSGKQSDFATCLSYNRPLMCHKLAYIEHLKPGLKDECTDYIILGRAKPEVIYEKCVHRGSDLGTEASSESSTHILPLV